MRRKFAKTRQELLNNTVAHYNSGNRAYTGTDCCYINQEGKCCAIGREVRKSQAVKLEDQYPGDGVVSSGVFNLLPNRLRDMGKDFLGAIQGLHDSKYNWNEEGLSSTGEYKVKDICNRFNLELPPSIKA